MQADRDEQTVQEAVDAGADGTHTQDSLTNTNQEAVNHGPDKVQGDADDQGDHHSHDGHKPTACKEAQEVRHVGLVELVVAPGGDQTAEDTDELVVNLAERSGNRIGFHAHDKLHHANTQHGLDGQPGNDGRQSGGTLLVLGHADGNAQGEEDSHVVNENAAGLDEQQSRHVVGAPAGGVDPVTDTHQDTADRQTCHRQHQGFT